MIKELKLLNTFWKKTEVKKFFFKKNNNSKYVQKKLKADFSRKKKQSYD